MKKFLLLIVCAAAFVYAEAQNFQAKRDTVWGCRYFSTNIETGKTDNTGSKKGTTSMYWPSSDVLVNYYCKIPVGRARVDMVYTPKTGAGLKLNVKVTNPSTGQVVYQGLVSTDRTLSSQETTIEIVPTTYFSQDIYYQIQLSTQKGGEAISRVKLLLFQREGTEPVVTPSVFMSPSAHNNTWGTTDPNAPTGNDYDWAYGEFLYPEQYAFYARYLMCLGGSGYYSGIQVCGFDFHNTALFSAWDNGDTDKDPNLPAYLRSGAVDNNTDVKISRFGNEGTGIQSMMSAAHWKRDHWVQWLMNARPENTQVILKAKDGGDSVITYINTILTAWYKMDTDPEWHYISTLRQSGTSHLLGAAGEYSFLENFSDIGGDNFVRCYMKNRFYRSAGSGKWYNRNHMTPGHYNYNDGARECRYDYGHGATRLYDNCFYIEHGGFYSTPNDSSMYVALATNTECVDTINIDAKIARIQEAFRKGNNKYLANMTDSLLHLSGGAKQVYDYVKSIIDLEGQIGGYDSEATAILKAAFEKASPTNVTELSKALVRVSQEYNVIRYANITSKTRFCSNGAFVFDNTSGYGRLYVDMTGGKPVLKCGNKGYDDMSANWIVVRSDKYGTMAVYNKKHGVYLDPNSETLLSAEAVELPYFGRFGNGFYFGSNSSTALVAKEDGSVTLDARTNNGGVFLAHDNLSYITTDAEVAAALEQLEAPNKFDEYKAKVPGILEAPEGVVGAWTDEQEKADLAALYDEGNISVEKADALISAIDNAKKLELSTEVPGAYILTANALETPEYLTIDADNFVYHKAATNKPDQVWLTKPVQGGYEVTSQGRSLASLNTTVGKNATTREEGDGDLFFFTEKQAGIFTLSDVQWGPTALNGTTSPLTSADFYNDAATWTLTPATDVKVTLNSGGSLTLFLDFDVTIPEGIEVYAIDSFDANGPLLAPIDGKIPARTPVILRGTAYGNYFFGIVPEQNFPTEASILQGTLLKKNGVKSKTVYTLSIKNGKPTFALSLGTSINANQCYIAKEDLEALGLTESQYAIDFDNITAVDDATATEAKANGKAYDIQGRETSADAKGIVIKNNQKVYNE